MARPFRRRRRQPTHQLQQTVANASPSRSPARSPGIRPYRKLPPSAPRPRSARSPQRLRRFLALRRLAELYPRRRAPGQRARSSPTSGNAMARRFRKRRRSPINQSLLTLANGSQSRSPARSRGTRPLRRRHRSAPRPHGAPGPVHNQKSAERRRWARRSRPLAVRGHLELRSPTSGCATTKPSGGPRSRSIS